MPPLGFEPTISAGERPQSDAFDRAANVTSLVNKNPLSSLDKESLLQALDAYCSRCVSEVHVVVYRPTT